jgi:hypothetical protein
MFVRRRIGDDGIGNTAVGNLVLPHLHRHGSDGSHRLDAIDVDFAELLDEGEDRIKLAAKALDFTFGDRDSGEVRDTAHSVAVD